MIGIIDYKAGNIASVQNALTKIGIKSFISDKPKELDKAKKLIFPGVGRASSAMDNLRQLNLVDFIKNYKKPFLGTCIGLQLLGEFSEEDQIECLGIIPAKVKKFPNKVKIPQIGWNKVGILKDSILTKNIKDNSYFYFVNSYYLEITRDFTIGKTLHGEYFSSIIKKDNFYATQFHAEKSGDIGLRLLKNFCQEV